MEQIKVSILVITYNQEEYITQTLESIFSQHHDYTYEVIIGDDCSTDKTPEKIKPFIERYSDKIHYVYNNPNKGLVKNYFDTISLCKGKYIIDIAGDDWFLPGRIETQIEFMEKHPECGMSYGKAKVFNAKKNKFTGRFLGDPICDFDSLLEKNHVPSVAWCLRRDLLTEYITEIRPLEKDWMMEDYPIILWFALNSKIMFIDSFLTAYRYLEDSASHFGLNIERLRLFKESENTVRNYFIKSFTNKKAVESYTQKEICYLLLKKLRISYRLWMKEYHKIPSYQIDKILKLASNPFCFVSFRLVWLMQGKMKK